MNAISAIGAAGPIDLIMEASAYDRASTAAPGFFNHTKVAFSPETPIAQQQMDEQPLDELLIRQFSGEISAFNEKSSAAPKDAPTKERSKEKNAAPQVAAPLAAAVASAEAIPVGLPQFQVLTPASPSAEASGEDRPSSPDPAGSADVVPISRGQAQSPEPQLALAALLTPVAAASPHGRTVTRLMSPLPALATPQQSCARQ